MIKGEIRINKELCTSTSQNTLAYSTRFKDIIMYGFISDTETLYAYYISLSPIVDDTIQRFNKDTMYISVDHPLGKQMIESTFNEKTRQSTKDKYLTTDIIDGKEYYRFRVNNIDLTTLVNLFIINTYSTLGEEYNRDLFKHLAKRYRAISTDDLKATLRYDNIFKNEDIECKTILGGTYNESFKTKFADNGILYQLALYANNYQQLYPSSFISSGIVPISTKFLGDFTTELYGVRYDVQRLNRIQAHFEDEDFMQRTRRYFGDDFKDAISLLTFPTMQSLVDYLAEEFVIKGKLTSDGNYIEKIVDEQEEIMNEELANIESTQETDSNKKRIKSLKEIANKRAAIKLSSLERE